jgi:hypothetical protein
VQCSSNCSDDPLDTKRTSTSPGPLESTDTRYPDAGVAATRLIDVGAVQSTLTDPSRPLNTTGVGVVVVVVGGTVVLDVDVVTMGDSVVGTTEFVAADDDVVADVGSDPPRWYEEVGIGDIEVAVSGAAGPAVDVVAAAPPVIARRSAGAAADGRGSPGRMPAREVVVAAC